MKPQRNTFSIIDMRSLVFTIFTITLLSLVHTSCSTNEELDPYVIVLGIAQDGGAPQAGCMKNCCIDRWGDPEKRLLVSSIGIVDPKSDSAWIIDVTPDFPDQLKQLTNNDPGKFKGAFITHAHIGHYSGLIHFGREVMGYKNTPVYAMPKMTKFIKANGPWSQLVKLKNIKIKSLKDDKKIKLNKRISITPFLVPHRDEFSETVGFKVEGPSKSLIYIPDIDKWQKWDNDLIKIVEENDYSLIDGTFAEQDELPGRDMSKIPHPFIVETMDILKPMKEKSKVYFIHLNHTNTALMPNSRINDELKTLGYKIASRGLKLKI